MGSEKNKKLNWRTVKDEQLLNMQFCDLQLKLERSPLAERIEQLYAELDRRGIRFRPHCWLAEEWFSPDGVPGIGIPFYLAHPRLMQLEYRQIFEVEGGSSQQCMQLLRHETGHAIMTAYRLNRKPRCRQIFGRFSKPYPEYYTPRPGSNRFVLHLDWWYAQAHPSEDFAETFAVWLQPRSQWRSHYKDWPAHKKLQYMDELMDSIAEKKPACNTKRQIEPISRLRKTLREHYEDKKHHYGVNIPEFYDEDLLRLFSNKPQNGQRRTAAAFLRRISPQLCAACARGTGEHPYTISQVLKEMIQRCREMRLYVNGNNEIIIMEIAVFLSMRVLHYLHRMRHRIPV